MDQVLLEASKPDLHTAFLAMKFKHNHTRGPVSHYIGPTYTGAVVSTVANKIRNHMASLGYAPHFEGKSSDGTREEQHYYHPTEKDHYIIVNRAANGNKHHFSTTVTHY